jgi:hypothetical protein
MSKSIEVLGGRKKDTRIVVRDWPDSRSPWRARSVDQRGRELAIEGYSNFEQVVVANMVLHVEDRKPLMVVGYTFEPRLVVADRPEVLAQLLLCARAIATRLDQDLGVGNGCLLWQIDSHQLAELSKRYSWLSPVPKHRRPRRRGKRFLLWKP